MPSQYTLNYFACLLFAFFTHLGSAPAASPGPAIAASPADSIYKAWYYTPTGVFGRLPLDHSKSRSFVKITHPSPDLAVVESINPAGITINTSKIHFKNGLIDLSTETDRWGDTYDSTWFQPDGPGKFVVTQRKKGVNPYFPCKYLQYTFRNDLLVEILCYLDSIRAGNDQEGVAHYVFERYDDPGRRGLIKTETFFSEIDVPVFSRATDCHQLINEYDLKGNLVTRSIYDQDERPTRDRYGVFRAKYKYDGDDNETQVDYYDTTGKLTLFGGSYAEKYFDYKHGFLSEESFYADATTRAVSQQLGNSVSIVDYKYDRDGNETETSYFDTQHEPVNNARSIQKVEHLYSASGMPTRTNLIALTRDGYQSKTYMTIRYNCDEKGRNVGQLYATNTGVIIPDAGNGAWLTKYSYDAWGRIHSSSCWQNDSTKMLCRLGYHEVILRYDDDGLPAERDFYDQYGGPASGRISYSRELIRRNAQGLPAERSYFAGDRPVLLQDNRTAVSRFHRMEYHYDQLNRLRSIEFYDQTGRPVNAILRSDNKKVFSPREVDLEYDGALLTAETLRDSGDSHPPVTLNCTTGECLALSAFETLSPAQADMGRPPARTYHGSFHPDTLFDNQLGFIGHDSILVFITADWGSQTDLACSEYYQVAPVNKFYQFDGRVTDYFLDNDSVAATFSYDQGYLEGPVYIFYHNGLIKEKGAYHNKVKYGTWEYYYDNGQKARTLFYQNGQPLLEDCYTRTGDVLARNGTGRFEGIIAPANRQNVYEMIAKGNVKDGVPDGQWDLYLRQFTTPSNTEYFSNGKFRHGISFALAGKTTYTGASISNIEGLHSYENIDHYRQDRFCRAFGVLPHSDDLYPEIKRGFGEMIKTNKYPAFNGWVFLDLMIGGDGHVLGSHVRLYQPNTELEKDIRDMAARLIYSLPAARSGEGASYEKMYIILLGNNEVVVPEELLQQQRNIVH